MWEFLCDSLCLKADGIVKLHFVVKGRSDGNRKKVTVSQNIRFLRPDLAVKPCEAKLPLKYDSFPIEEKNFRKLAF